MEQTITTAWIAYEGDYVEVTYAWERYEGGRVTGSGVLGSLELPSWLSESALFSAVDAVIEKMAWRRSTEWESSGAGVFAARIEPVS